MEEITISYLYKTKYDRFENEFTLEQLENGHWYDWYMNEVPDDAELIERTLKIKFK